MDALLDDPVFFAPFERFLTPGGGGSAVDASRQPQYGRIRHHQAHRRRPKSWGSRGELVEPHPMARVMAQARRGGHAEAWPQHKRGP